jgi:hypothetical protein
MSRFIHSLILIITSFSLADCARQQMKFDNLEKRDKLRFTACRHDVVRALCPDDPDCDIKAAELYAAEPHDSRKRWLLDYHCPPDKIQHADDVVKEQERKSIGM